VKNISLIYLCICIYVLEGCTCAREIVLEGCTCAREIVLEGCTCAREIVLLYVFYPLYILEIQFINLLLRRGSFISMYLMLIHEIIHATCVVLQLFFGYSI